MSAAFLECGGLPPLWRRQLLTFLISAFWSKLIDPNRKLNVACILTPHRDY